MKVLVRRLSVVSILFLSFQTASAQVSLASVTRAEPRPIEFIDSRPPVMPESVIAAFLTAETKVREALNQYTFKRDVVLQTIDDRGEVTGVYMRNSQFLFDDKGNRIERVLYRPASTLRGMRITKEDIQDLEGAQLLGIDITETSKYRLEYVGAETSGNRELFVIKVTPRQTPNPHRMRERFFVGRIWVDAGTFQITRVHGQVEPQGKQRFPVFETRRELAAEQFFFPAVTEADDMLRFPEYDVHYRVKVKCYDYKRFTSKVTLTEVDPSAE